MTDDSAATQWDAYLARTGQGSAYHAHAWGAVLQRLFGHETHYFAARDAAGEIVGVLPLVRLRSRLFGDFLVSMPYFNYGGVVADSEEVARRLMTTAAEHARQLGVSHMELRHHAQMGCDWPVRTDKVVMLLQLPDSVAALQKQISSKLRSQIRRPQKEGAVGASGGIELLDEFYSVFAHNMRDLGTPVYPRRFFATILQAFAAQARIFVVRHAGVPVAAGLTFARGPVLEIPWASSLRSANALSVNMLLYWNVLEFAVNEGFRVFDFGRSTLDSGTFRFKKQWGAEPAQLYWHYWLSEGTEPPKLNHSNPKYRAAIALWQRLPLAVANRLGPLLAPNLP